MKTREITLTGNGRWVKIVRDDSKCFSFYIGWKSEFKSYKSYVWGRTIKTWKDARELAQSYLDN